MAYEIVPGLFVCDLHAVSNKVFSGGIDVFVSACKCDASKYDIFLRELDGELICLKSVTNEIRRVGPYVDKELRQGRKIAIFCETGLQRSPSLALAYLISCGGLPFESALTCLRSKHPTAFPEGCIYRQVLHELQDSKA